jgi:hypothetical protein
MEASLCRAECLALIGGNSFSATTIAGEQVLVPVVIDSEPLILFRVEDGHLLLSLAVNGADNEPVLVVEDNELVLMVDAAWDFEWAGTRFRIRHASRQMRRRAGSGRTGRCRVPRANGGGRRYRHVGRNCCASRKGRPADRGCVVGDGKGERPPRRPDLTDISVSTRCYAASTLGVNLSHRTRATEHTRFRPQTTARPMT